MNRASGLLPNQSARLTHQKIYPLEREAIDGGNRVNVYTAGVHRVVLVICKDLLDQDRLLHAIARAGASIVLVPARTPVSNQFPGRSEYLVTRARAYSITANGPVRYRARDVAVFGQPVMDREVVQTPAADAKNRGFALLKIGSNRAEWHDL